MRPEGSDQKVGRSSLLLHFDASSSRMAINAAADSENSFQVRDVPGPSRRVNTRRMGNQIRPNREEFWRRHCCIYPLKTSEPYVFAGWRTSP